MSSTKRLDYMWDTWECTRCAWTWNSEQDIKCQMCYHPTGAPVPKPKKMLEAELLKAVIGYLNVALPGCWIYKIHGGMFARAGVPDLLCVNKGTPIFLELKTMRNKLSESQVSEIFKLQEAGAQVFVPYSVDELRDFLKMRGLTEVDIEL